MSVKNNNPNSSSSSILATSGTAKKQRDWKHQLFLPVEEGEHRDFGLHFTRQAGGRLFLLRLFWAVRCEVEWSTAGSHLCVTVSLEERGLSTGRDDSRVLPHEVELFQTHPLFDNIKGPRWPLSGVTPHCCDVDTVELFPFSTDGAGILRVF